MKYYHLLILFFSPLLGFSQDVMTLEKAITTALQKNFGVQISNLEQEAEGMQVYRSNAGFGPVVDANAGLNASGNNVNQNFADGRIINRWGRSVNPFVNLTVGIPLYDGGRMEATLNRLGLLSQLSEAEGKLIIQNIVAQVMEAYYNISLEKERSEYLQTIIKYYKERLKITEERWKVGKGSKIDFLQSQIDLNAQLSELSRSENDLENAKVVLNGLLNRAPSEDFVIEKTAPISKDYLLADLINQAKNKNRSVLLLQKTMQISLQQEKELEANRKPQVSFNGTLGYSYNNTNAGFLLSNRNLFATAGLAARWNLYDGNNRKNQIAISKINTQIVAKQQEQLEAQILNDLTIAFNQYQSDKELLAFESLNETIAKENLTISLEKFRLGGSSILELNEAQRAYDTALNRLVDAQFNIKISELDLLSLSGALIE